MVADKRIFMHPNSILINNFIFRYFSKISYIGSYHLIHHASHSVILTGTGISYWLTLNYKVTRVWISHLFSSPLMPFFCK